MAIAFEKKTFLGLTSEQAAELMGGTAPVDKEKQCVGALTGEEFAEIVGSGGGGGGGGTTNYNALTNKPSIAGVELRGDKTLADIGAATSTKVSQLETTLIDNVDKTTNLQSSVNSLSTTVAGHTETISQHSASINSLKATVGDNTTGLVKDTADNTAAIDTLNNIVGNTTSGLVKAVADNATAIDTLNGDGEGSVAKAIRDAAPGYASETTAGLVKVGENLSIDENGVMSASMGSTVVVDDALDNTSTNPVQNKIVAAAINQNATDIDALNTTVGDTTSGLVKDVADNTAAISDNATVITNLQTTAANLSDDLATLNSVVGDDTGGLVKDVNDAASNIAALQSTVGDNTAGLVKAVADNTSDISDNTSALATINGSDAGSSMRDVAEDVVSTIPKSITPKGTVAFADLPSLSDAEIGDMYNVSDDFTTTADFVMGAGVEMNANSNVYVIDAGPSTKKWDVFATQGIADMSAYQTKELTSHTGITATTVEGALEEVAGNAADNASDISDLQTVVGDSTAGLVKDVSDLQTTVGDDTAGLVKDVADNQTAMIERTHGPSTPVVHFTTNAQHNNFAPFILAWLQANRPGVTDGILIVYFDNDCSQWSSMSIKAGTSVPAYFHFSGSADTDQLNVQFFYAVSSERPLLAYAYTNLRQTVGSWGTTALYADTRKYAIRAAMEYVSSWEEFQAFIMNGGENYPQYADIYTVGLKNCPITGPDGARYSGILMLQQNYDSSGPYYAFGMIYGITGAYGTTGRNYIVTVEGEFFDSGDWDEWHCNVEALNPDHFFTFTTYPTAKRLTITGAPRCLKLWGDIAHNPGMDIISVAGSGSAKYLHIAGSNIVTAISGSQASLVIDCAVSTGAINQLILEGVELDTSKITVTDL